MIDKNSVVYQLVTDRFDNECGDLHRLRESESYRDKFGCYMGGTFKGIERHIGYFKDLGISHLLISPVEDCNGDDSYHGYHPVKPGKINPRFGTSEDLKRMVKKLKDGGIGTVLDYIPVHISSESDLFREKMKTEKGRQWFAMKDLMNHSVYGEQICSLAYKLTDGNTKSLGDVNGEKEYLGYFGLDSLPLFNLYNSEVIDFHIDRLRGLVEEYDFSDIRFDSGFIQPRGVIKKIKQGLEGVVDSGVSVLPEYWPFYDFSGGECYGFSDGEFNIKGTMLLNNFGREPGVIFNLREHYSRVRGISNNDYSFVTGLSNHDLPRFDGDNETQKMAALLQFTLPAFTPMIFYGEEMPMRTINGGTDRIAMSRDVMPFGGTPELFDFYKRLIAFRKGNDFNGATVTNFQINDVINRRHAENQLVSYNLNFPNSNNSFHIVVNREYRDKPISSKMLFGVDCVSSRDNVGGRTLERLEDGRIVIPAHDSVVLDNMQNS